jgi:4-hydroxybenzoate polyprenyltransferase
VDAREQPTRPIPSGRISWRSAASLGWTLWASGILVAWLASAITKELRPGVVATLLALCVVIYDRVLRRTPISPLVMGACRALNVLLGMSLASLAAEAAGPNVGWWSAAMWLISGGIGIYVIGVTLFARTDAQVSPRRQLVGGFLVLLCGMGLLAATPVLASGGLPLMVNKSGWFLLWILLAAITARRCLAGIIDPSSRNVQMAVRHCVQSIIVLDAAVSVGYAGPIWGFAVLALIFPTVALTAWLRST